MEQYDEFNYDKKIRNLGDEIQSPKLIAEKLLGKSAVTSSLTIPLQKHDTTTGKTDVRMITIPFYMENDFSIGSITAKWEDLVNINGENAFTNLLNAVSIMSAKAQVTPQSEAMSSKVYKGTDFGGFSVNCLFVATRRTQDPLDIIQMLAATVLPGKAAEGDPSVSKGIEMAKSFGHKAVDLAQGFGNLVLDGAQEISKIGNNGTARFNATDAKKTVDDLASFSNAVISDLGMTAPLQYGIMYDDTTQDGKRQISGVKPRPFTTVMLQVGDYFRAPGLLVSGINSITFSKEVIKPINPNNGRRGQDIYDNSPQGTRYGFPLYVRCTVNLVPSSMMHLEKFQKYFIDPTNKSFNNESDNLIKTAAQLP